nr:MAG TPA: hypothetical protein [Caudoviricetes sp.]
MSYGIFYCNIGGIIHCTGESTVNYKEKTNFFKKRKFMKF